MSDPSIVSTNHTSFTVSSLTRSIAFFEQVLGFAATPPSPRSKPVIQSITGVQDADVLIAYLRGPDHSIELIEYVGPSDRSSVMPRPCDVGFAHIAFDVTGIESLVESAAAFDVLPIGEITTVDQGPNKGGKAVYLRDPDGITVELIQKP